ncbi:MAG: hypothetical protein KF802_08830 [Bdellovibrionaceae bacterium]|nr:hypothetical protein [Pseudobdellovibrionaceae bacterium]
MRTPLLFSFLAFALSTGPKAQAQADFTSQLMSSGRYEVKKKKTEEVQRAPAAEKAPDAPGVKSAPVVPVQPPAPAMPPVVLPSPKPATEVAAAAGKEDATEPTLAEQARALVDGENDSVTTFYRERIHPEDVRNNKVEIQVSGGYSYLDSKSNYSYREYHSAYSNVDLRSNVWFAPRIGVTGSIRFSLGASVAGDAATHSMDPFRDEIMEMGIKLRRYFGLSRVSPSFEFSLLYMDRSFNVATDSTSHARLRTSGVGIGAKVVLPSSADHAWVLGGKIAPRLKHQEMKAAVDLKSGEQGENVLVGVEAGGEWRFGRGSQFVYGLELNSERNLFTGAASPVDPTNGQTPSNVTVTSTLLNFSLGYRWGH